MLTNQLPRATAEARAAAQSDTVVKLARAGYVARGAVYALIGGLSLQLALGRGGEATGAKGALQYLANLPFGRVLLALVGIGFLGFALWRFAESLLDLEQLGTDKKALLKRAGRLFGGLIYGGLAISAFAGLRSGHVEQSGDAPQSRTADLLSMPFGRLLVAAIGIGIIAYGISELRKALNKKFERPLMLEGVAAERRTSLERLCAFGMAARGGVFLAMGAFLVSAAIHSDPTKAKSLGQVLLSFAQAPFGTALMVVVALGLLSYGLYSAVVGRYGRFAGKAPRN